MSTEAIGDHHGGGGSGPGGRPGTLSQTRPMPRCISLGYLFVTEKRLEMEDG